MPSLGVKLLPQPASCLEKFGVPKAILHLQWSESLLFRRMSLLAIKLILNHCQFVFPFDFSYSTGQGHIPASLEIILFQTHLSLDLIIGTLSLSGFCETLALIAFPVAISSS